MRILKYETAPQKDWFSGTEFKWVGGHKVAIVNINAIAAFYPVSNGPDGMKRTKILLISGKSFLGIGTPNDFVKGWVGDTHKVFPEMEIK